MRERHERIVTILEKLADCASHFDAGFPLAPDRALVTVRAYSRQTCPGLSVGDLREARRLLDEMRRA